MSQDTDRANPKPPSLDRLSLLWRRVNDHKMVQWSVAYVALAYGIQHGIVLTREAFDWPHAIEQISMLLLALGLPVTVTFAWYHGERASRRISGPELTIIAILLAIGSLFFYVLVRPSEEVAARTPAAQQAGVAAARTAAASPKGAISLAVLPFVNLSSDKEQEFFSDGMTEEITTALAKVPDLRVVARTSAFEFKGKNVDIGKIGEQLHATHLIEGSVRKAGNRLRITAQLIKADDGTHIWAEDYDRELTDIFAVQEDIARAITASLRMPLGLKPGENLVNNRSIDSESYENFLRAKALNVSRARGDQSYLPDVSKAASLLEGVVARNPSYAPAWEGLGVTYFLVANAHASYTDEPIDQSRRLVSELREKGEAAEKRAIQLDPNSAGAYGTLGVFAWSRGKLLDAEVLFNKELALDPNSAAAGYILRLATSGRIKDALAMAERAHVMDPLNSQFISSTIADRWLNGDNDGAIALAKTARPVTRAPLLSMIYASLGRFGEAAEALSEIASDPNSGAAQAARLLRTAPAKIASEKLPRLPAAFEFAYLYVGAPDRAIASYERRVDVGLFSSGVNTSVWHASYEPVRKTERFKALMRKSGLVDYWRVKGWPDQCHPTTADDFVCN